MCEALFNGWDITEGMKAIKEAGVDAFEFWGWWGKDLDEIKRAKEELGLNIAAFCTRMISLVDSTLREDYIKGLKETIEVARYLGCNKLITQVGNELGDVDRVAAAPQSCGRFKDMQPHTGGRWNNPSGGTFKHPGGSQGLLSVQLCWRHLKL